MKHQCTALSLQSTRYIVMAVVGTLAWLPVLVLAQPVTKVELKNPLAVGTIEELLSALLGVVLVLATPIIIFFIIYSGFLYVTAQGNPEQVKQASRSLTYAVIGGVIVIGAFAIATMVENLVAAF
jgi:amino acid transporter